MFFNWIDPDFVYVERSINHFDLTYAELGSVKDTYLYPSSSRKFEHLVVARRFLENFGPMFRRYNIWGIFLTVCEVPFILILYVFPLFVENFGKMKYPALDMVPVPITTSTVGKKGLSPHLLLQSRWRTKWSRSARKLVTVKVMDYP